MDQKRVIRINKVLREENISLEKAVGILQRYGISIDANPNAKISESENQILKDFLRKPEIIQKIETTYNIVLANKDEFKDKSGYNHYNLNEAGELISLDIMLPIEFDINLLVDQIKLTELSLIDVKIKNSDSLGRLNHLRNLQLMNNDFNLGSIEKLKNLSVLSISDSAILDFNFIPVNLKILSLIKCDISELGFLSKMKNLISLNLSDNKISDLSPLKVFSVLENLYLSNNLIEDISCLKNIKINNELFLSNNKIFDLSPLYNEFKRGKMFLNYNDNPVLYPPIEFERLHETGKWRWFEDCLDRARMKIKEAIKNKSKKLNLGGCGLTDLELLPELFEECKHIEELILSNQYAKYNLQKMEWDREVTTVFYPNNISAIPKEILKLKYLKVLIIGGDWKETKDSKSWRIRNVDFLSELTKLKVINISNNLIERLPELAKLKSLETIHANNNLIEKVSSLKGLKILKEIYLSNNRIDDLSFLEGVNSIETLDLHQNRISNILPIKGIIDKIGIEDGKWIVGTVCVKDNKIDESFVNILRDNAENVNKEEQIKNYFKRLKQGDYVDVMKLKVVLLGNTGAGKTTLADILSGEANASNGSTHGVNFFSYKLDEITVKGYDFGGQDYYHNTHYSFFDNRALYVLVWGNDQKDEFHIKNDEMLLPLDYWLGSLNVFTYSELIYKFYEHLVILRQQNDFAEASKLNLNGLLEFSGLPVVGEDFAFTMVDDFLKETKISLNSFKSIRDSILKKLSNVNIDGPFKFNSILFQNVNQDKFWINEFDVKEKFGFIYDFATYNFLGERDELKAKLATIATKFSTETKQLKIDHEMGLQFELNKSRIILNSTEIRNLKDEIKSYDDQELESLLQSLHSTLSCYYFKIEDKIKQKLHESELEDIVIVDIELFTNWIYEIFEQKSDHSSSSESNKIRKKGKEGYFNREDAKKWINDSQASRYIDYILAFMLENKMIFKIIGQDCFFAPNYLSDVLTQTEELFLKSFETPIVKYVFNGHFHTSVISEIIDKYIDHLMYESTKMKYVLWKNKVLLYEDNHKNNKLVYLHLDVLCVSNPTISISRYSNSVSDQFILDLCDFIERVIKNYDYSKMLLSRNGRYIPFDALNIQYLGFDEKKVNLFSFENIIYRRSDFKMFLPHENNNYPMKKIFISYSKDDLVMVNQLLDHLEPLKRDGLISTWYCTELIAGGEWDKDIQQNFDESDIICFMISPNLMRTDYVFNYEIKNAIDRGKKDEDFKIVPIILSYCSWITKDYNLGNYTALPYTAKPVSDFNDKDMAWYIVTECIKILIKSTKQPNGDNWYGGKLPKDVRKIYERIVQNKVDNNS